MNEKLRMDFRKLRDWTPLVMSLAALVGAGYVAMFRLGQVEARVERQELRIDGKADKDELKQIRETLGFVQLDVNALCVAQLGVAACRTTRNQ